LKKEIRMPDDRNYQLVAPGFKPRALLFGLLVTLPLTIILAATLWDLVDSQASASASVGSSPDIVTLGTAIFLLLLWLLLDLVMKRHRLQLDGGQLQIRTSFYTRDVALSELQLDQARVVDLDERPEFKPALKTNGYALPGFKSGHFRLHNGEKAFVAIAGGPRALWLPTTSGKGLLLQPGQPDALLKHLRELAQPQPRR
jgi:hypothetical protein